MLWCNGKQQNETLMLRSSYDNRLVGGDATAGAANGKIIICKHDVKLKKIGKTKRRTTTLVSSPVFGAKSGSKASQMAAKIEPISGKKQSKNCLINGYQFVSLREAFFIFV